MNVNETLKTMFSDLLPVAADTYKGKATEYIVFNYTAIPAISNSPSKERTATRRFTRRTQALPPPPTA